MLFKFHFEKVKPGGGFMITNEATDSQVTILARDFGVMLIDTAKANNGYQGGRETFFFPAQYRELQKSCMNILLDLPHGSKSNDYEPEFWAKKKTEKPLPRKLRKWWYKKARFVVRKRFGAHWQELMEKYSDPGRRSLSKAICSSLGPSALGNFGCDFLESVYQSKYWADDIRRFPAAAYALRAISQRHIVVDDMSWMELYSDTGRTYTSLNKTLMAMPRRMHTDIVGDMKMHHLNEPWYGRAKILFMLEYQFRDDIDNRHLAVFRRSTNDDIVRVARMARRRHFTFKMNRLTNIITFKTWLNDYPEPYNGDLKGLFMRSFRWHNELQDENLFGRAHISQDKYGDDYCLVQPPWGELEIDGLSFLKTAGDVRDERKRMKHCIHTYIDKAARGKCFIYHYKKGKDKATIEVNKNGVVVQAYGPCNQHNDACKDAKILISNELVKKSWQPSEDSSLSPQRVARVDKDLPF